MGIKIAVLGIGNLLLRDEGIGIHAIRMLRERYTFPEDILIIDGGTMGLDLLPYIEGKDRLILIDAVDFKEEPGFIKILEDDNIKVFLDTKFSVHQIGIPDMLFAAAFSGILPSKICLIGIQPDKIETGLELSEKLNSGLPAFVETVIEKLKSWGVEIQNVPCNTV